MNRREFFKGLTVAASAVMFWRPKRPTVKPTFYPVYGVTENGHSYMCVQAKTRLHRGQLAYWEDGRIAGVAMADVTKRNYGFIQLNNI